MTHDTEPGDARLEDQSYLVVAALADGESVEPAALKVALGDPAVRDYLVDLIALRQAVSTLSATVATSRQERQLLTRAGWLTAAAAVVMSLTAGYFAGQRTAAQPLSAPMIETAVGFSGAVVAPKPTHVVPLRPGVNWTETAGGQ